MVCIRNLTGLLLALAAAPSVIAKPVAVGGNDLVAREPQGGIIGSLLGGDDDSSSSSASATPTRNTPSTTPTPTVNSRTSTSAQPTSTASPSQTSSPAQQTTTAPRVTSTPAVTSTPEPRTTIQASGTQSQLVVFDIIYSTTGGQVLTAASTQAVASPTDSADASTSTPKPNPDQGLSTGAKVGAAVGGAAGLILILGLGYVAWRIWGKNRKGHEEDDALMDDHVYGTSEVKSSTTATTGTSPFQNNLEQYHNGRTNPSANF